MKILISCINHSCEMGVLSVVSQIIQKIEKPEDVSYKIIIFDNSEEQLKSEEFVDNLHNLYNLDAQVNQQNPLSNEHELRHIKNGGFGAGHNIAIDLAQKEQFDVTWILDPDIQLDGNCLKSLVTNITTKYTILGSVIHEPTQTYLGTNGLNSWRSYKNVKGKADDNNIISVDAVIGASIFIKTNEIDNLRFDETYFMYVEENDFCNEARKRGLSVGTDCNSILWHEGGLSMKSDSALIWYYKTRNLYFFRAKNCKRSELLIIYLLVVTLIKYRLKRKYLFAYLYGVYDYYLSSKGNTRRSFN